VWVGLGAGCGCCGDFDVKREKKASGGSRSGGWVCAIFQGRKLTNHTRPLFGRLDLLIVALYCFRRDLIS
jgi:hypothetical protein